MILLAVSGKLDEFPLQVGVSGWREACSQHDERFIAQVSGFSNLLALVIGAQVSAPTMARTWLGFKMR